MGSFLGEYPMLESRHCQGLSIKVRSGQDGSEEQSCPIGHQGGAGSGCIVRSKGNFRLLWGATLNNKRRLVDV